MNEPVPITVDPQKKGAGGLTFYSFLGEKVYGWRMKVQGTQSEILESVLPHEVAHIITSLRFKKPLPRWADEGIATVFEQRSEKLKLIKQLSRKKDWLPLREVLSTKEYPKQIDKTLMLYAQAMVFIDALLSWDAREDKTPFEAESYPQKNRERLLKFLDAEQVMGWEKALREHYGLTLDEAEKHWRAYALNLLEPRQNLIQIAQP